MPKISIDLLPHYIKQYGPSEFRTSISVVKPSDSDLAKDTNNFILRFASLDLSKGKQIFRDESFADIKKKFPTLEDSQLPIKAHLLDPMTLIIAGSMLNAFSSNLWQNYLNQPFNPKIEDNIAIEISGLCTDDTKSQLKLLTDYTGFYSKLTIEIPEGTTEKIKLSLTKFPIETLDKEITTTEKDSSFLMTLEGESFAACPQLIKKIYQPLNLNVQNKQKLQAEIQQKLTDLFSARLNGQPTSATSSANKLPLLTTLFQQPDPDEPKVSFPKKKKRRKRKKRNRDLSRHPQNEHHRHSRSGKN